MPWQPSATVVGLTLAEMVLRGTRTRSARFPLYLAPGNHDIWSEASGRLFRHHACVEPA